MNWLGVAGTMVRMTFGKATSAGGARSAALSGARVSYWQTGRSGSVVFSQGATCVEKYFEFGGYVVACVVVTSAMEWERLVGGLWIAGGGCLEEHCDVCAGVLGRRGGGSRRAWPVS